MQTPSEERPAATVDLSRVDRLWRCVECGYLAFSSPWSETFDEDGNYDGTYWHDCPNCGRRGETWHWCGGDDREKRIGYLQEFLRGR